MTAMDPWTWTVMQLMTDTALLEDMALLDAEMATFLRLCGD